MPDTFKEIIPSILQTKENVLRDDLDERDYNSFLVNRALSYHMDCVLYANEMNMAAHCDGKLKYHYLLNSVRSMKRKFQPWQKSSNPKDLECVKLYFGYSNAKAKDALRILSNEQLAEIRQRTDIGGIAK
jgi:hypothetical protein